MILVSYSHALVFRVRISALVLLSDLHSLEYLSLQVIRIYFSVLIISSRECILSKLFRFIWSSSSWYYTLSFSHYSYSCLESNCFCSKPWIFFIFWLIRSFYSLTVSSKVFICCISSIFLISDSYLALLIFVSLVVAASKSVLSAYVSTTA